MLGYKTSRTQVQRGGCKVAKGTHLSEILLLNMGLSSPLSRYNMALGIL